MIAARVQNISACYARTHVVSLFNIRMTGVLEKLYLHLNVSLAKPRQMSLARLAGLRQEDDEGFVACCEPITEVCSFNH